MSTTDNLQKLTYSGQVSVSIAKGKKILTTKQYHNKGLPNLFKFLCSALAGTYRYNAAPSKVQLLRYKGTKTPNNIQWDSDFINGSEWDNEKVEVCSAPILFSTAPMLVTDSNNKSQAFFQFRIPYSILTGNSINTLVIFPNKLYMTPQDAMAYYFCTEVNEDNELTWCPIDVTEKTQNYSLLIEWSMSIDNS